MPTKKCPFCAEEIQQEAIKCKHCHERLGDIRHEGQSPDIAGVPRVACPVCKSTQLTAQKQGFGAGNAILGMVFGIGIWTGFLGSNKIRLTCLSCGHQFAAGQQKKAAQRVITMNTLAWPVGLLALLTGVFALTTSPLASLVLCLSTAFMLPPLSHQLAKKMPALSKPDVRYIIGCLALVIGAIILGMSTR